MTKKILLITLLVVLIGAFACLTSGCGQKDILDEPDITVEYLQGEYAEQLTRDGAEIVLGTIDVTGTVSGTPVEGSTEGGITLTQMTINAKELAQSDTAEDVYFLEDKNLAYIVFAGAETRVACDLTGDGTLQVYPIEQFVNSYDAEALYKVYLFDEQVLLIIETTLGNPGAVSE